MNTLLDVARARLARARKTGDQDDAGVSLLEVLIAGTICLIVMAMGLTFFVRAVTSTDDATSDSINVAQARVTLEAWSGLVRVADSPVLPGTSANRFESISATDLVFYADLDNRTSLNAVTAPWKIWLSTAGGQLIERRYRPDSSAVPATYSTYPGSPAVTRRLAGCSSTTSVSTCVTPGTVSNSGAAFVAYYPQSATCPAASVVNGTLCKVDTTSPAALSDAIAVGISFTVTTPGKRQSRGFTTLVSVIGSSG